MDARDTKKNTNIQMPSNGIVCEKGSGKVLGVTAPVLMIWHMYGAVAANPKPD